MAETGSGRLYSLDAFRGMTMIWMFSVGFGLGVFDKEPGLLGAVARLFEHADWVGMNAWDLIQPFFMFIVGVAMPLSFARRWAAGETWARSLAHVLKRCLLLIVCGLVARSIQGGKPTLDLINVLAQLSFTYLAAFLVLRRGVKTQAAAAFALLVAVWAIYQFSGYPDPWAKKDNIGWHLDALLLGKNWGGGYATINCLGSSFNTIFGVIAGVVLTSAGSFARKARILGGVGVILGGAGLALAPAVPIIKKIWTPSFALLSTGCCLLALLGFYWVCDVLQRRSWAQVFVVVGANSIFIYLFHEILGRWMRQTAPVFTGWAITWWGPWGQVFTACALVAFQIYVCYWLWQRRIFFKL